MASEAPAAADRGVPARGPAVFGRLLIGANAQARRALAGIIALTLLRVVLGAVLPLSFDEAYYWLWSKHLAFSYFDHPPAIAYAIRLGALLFGATSIGVRAVPLLCSVLASWAVWRSAALLLEDDQKALRACLYFNLTLMVAVESMAATPDALALCASSLVVWAVAKLKATGDGRWWLVVGGFGGLCLLSKYTGFFLGAGVLFWLLAARDGRRWLATIWPYLGGVIAIALFGPVILWNAGHDWISFKFQFGRVTTGGWTARYLLEFILAEMALASPFILILGGAGFVRASRVFDSVSSSTAVLAALLWPAVAYFAIHALHDRVQGNWPSFLFPAFTILAAFAATGNWTTRVSARLVSASRFLVIPVAAAMLAATCAQALFGIVPVRDPIARLTAIGFKPIADKIEHIAQERKARAIATTSYSTTAWLLFYMKPGIPVVQINEDYRWLSAPRADASLLQAPVVYVVLHPKTPKAEPIRAAQSYFSRLRPIASLDRRRHGVFIERYDIYEASGWRGATTGRIP